MKQSSLPVTAIALFLLAFGLSGSQIGGCNPFTPPPFKTEKLAVLIVEETKNRDTYTQDQLNAIDATDATSVKVAVESRGGEFQHIDLDTTQSLAKALPWVREALAVKRDSLPWAVAATPTSGFSVPLTTEADLRTRVAGLH